MSGPVANFSVPASAAGSRAYGYDIRGGARAPAAGGGGGGGGEVMAPDFSNIAAYADQFAHRNDGQQHQQQGPGRRQSFQQGRAVGRAMNEGLPGEGAAGAEAAGAKAAGGGLAGLAEAFL